MPMERVSDVVVDNVDKGCVTMCLPDVTSISIRDQMSVHLEAVAGRQHVVGAIGVGSSRVIGHANVEELRSQIMKARDADRRGHAANTTVVLQQQSGGPSGGSRSIQERLADLEGLRNGGVIDDATYDAK